MLTRIPAPVTRSGPETERHERDAEADTGPDTEPHGAANDPCRAR
jgi:hypothetical protein